MFYDPFTRELKLTLRPVKIGGHCLGFILPKRFYNLNKDHLYTIDLKITNVTLSEREAKKNGSRIRY